MKISDLMKMGLRNLGRRKARTSLTVIGIVIGTISIVVMISIGIGMNESFRKTMMEFGNVTNITVSKHHFKPTDDGQYEEKEQKLNDELVEKLKRIPHVKNVSAQISMQVEMFSGRYKNNAQIYIMNSDVFKDFGFPELKNGATYERSKSKNKIKIWAGKQVFAYFYNPNSSNFSPKKVDPNKDRVQVQIMDYNLMEYDEQGNPKIVPKKYKAEIAVFDSNDFSEYSWSCYMDKGQFEVLYKEMLKQVSHDKRKKAEKKLKEYENIIVNADNVENVEEIQEAIKEIGFSSTSLSDMTKQIESTSKTIQMVLGGVGAVSMLVAAISIANTMVMSIYERTKEIGVMKVLGCQLTDIRKLFLFEAAMMGLIGGVIGIVLSYGASNALNVFGGKIGQALNVLGSEGEASKISVIPLWLPIAASFFSMGVGVISGYYPASRATKISAIEAMKNE